LDLPGLSALVSVEFIVDTGFEGDLALPATVLQRLDAQPLFRSLRSLADGTIRECPVYQVVLEWSGDERPTQVLGLEHNPLLGVLLLEGCHLDVEFVEGAEVLIEFLG
jgi:clan AA aspartic protease